MRIHADTIRPQEITAAMRDMRAAGINWVYDEVRSYGGSRSRMHHIDLYLTGGIPPKHLFTPTPEGVEAWLATA